METIVLNTKFEPVGIIDTYESFIWSDRYNEYGDFEIYTSANSKLLELVQLDYYLWMKDTEHMMIVESISIETDSEDGDHLTISGRSLESILDRRVIWNQTIFKGKLQNGIKRLLDQNVISPLLVDRKISNFVFQESKDERITSLTMDAQYTGDELYEAISELCKKNNIGFKIILNESNEFVFSLYIGEDRSRNQSKLPYVIFSPTYDNLTSSSFVESKKLFKNVNLVAGEGEGSARKKVSVGKASGLERREMFTDARDLSTTTENGTISNDEYNKQLKQRGAVKLSDNNDINSFAAEIAPKISYVYGKDYNLGDIVQVSNEYGKRKAQRISELTFTQTSTGNKVYPTFSKVIDDVAEDVYTEILGNFVNNYVAKFVSAARYYSATEDGIHLTSDMSLGDPSGNIWASNMIDVTQYTRLDIVENVLYAPGSASSTPAVDSYAQLLKNAPKSTEYVESDTKVEKAMNVVKLGKRTINIDLSSLYGEYYLNIHVGNTDFDITKITLVKG